jgi:hemerythrin-like domain-containing protein
MGSRRMVLAGALVMGIASVSAWGAGGKEKSEEDEPEVTAAEDLMREHGVLRRALLVYSEAAMRLASGKGEVPLEPLGQTAALFHTFGEEYHERSLEEKHVFPSLIEAGGQTAGLARTLTAQHERGRQITDYISLIAKKGRISPADSRPLARALASFVRMYEHHAAIEDTIIFPAWKRSISAARYRELNEQFEELEHRMFGKQGFEDAVRRIADVEQAYGLRDLAALTAPPPPKSP